MIGDNSKATSAITVCPFAAEIADRAHCKKSASHSRAAACATNDGNRDKASKL